MTQHELKIICEKNHFDRHSLMDILHEIHDHQGFTTEEDIRILSENLKISEIDLRQTISFYHFFACSSRGKYTIYLNNSAISNLKGREEIEKVFIEEGGCVKNGVSPDGLIGLYETPCIGMSDQEPAALINGRIFTNLTAFRAKELLHNMKKGLPLEDMYTTVYGDGRNAHPEMKSIVRNNIRRVGPLLRPSEKMQVLKNQVSQMSPEQVLEQVKLAELRGRGGAGFPTGLKWQFCRMAEGKKKYVFCNADEGEPGTFKDRVLLTEKPEDIIEGMIIAGYAIGAQEGVLYLRYEYKYMKNYLEYIIQTLREEGFLGKNPAGIKGFSFDMRIQLGAGSYVCGEESALIESTEGKRGEPRSRPPFPVEKGYLGYPTVVNNVETFCAAVKIVQFGGDWYNSLGTDESKGTKLVSVSGDCRYPGIYELEWGFTMRDVLEMVGAKETRAVQMGGPSGELVNKHQFDRILCYSDLATGGSIMIFDRRRNVIEDVVVNFMEFFINESCGSCVPCRNIPKLLKEKLDKILSGKGTSQDLADMERWGAMMKINRCGLGHTAAHPILSSLKNFRSHYERKLRKHTDFISDVDLLEASKEAAEYTNREPVI
ncbi:MAG TPA: NADP oxidoreductase [Flavobacteriales bacterium]|jgi:[NiFe] hydrogenase diaphorase moiety large subunit|nr:NADP oxidoreductase [Flavobacteriales bacterium]